MLGRPITVLAIVMLGLVDMKDIQTIVDTDNDDIVTSGGINILCPVGFVVPNAPAYTNKTALDRKLRIGNAKEEIP